MRRGQETEDDLLLCWGRVFGDPRLVARVYKKLVCEEDLL